MGLGEEGAEVVEDGAVVHLDAVAAHPGPRGRLAGRIDQGAAIKYEGRVGRIDENPAVGGHRSRARYAAAAEGQQAAHRDGSRVVQRPAADRQG